MVPVVELRGAIPLGLSLGLSPFEAYIISAVGNMLPVPFIILLTRLIFEWLRKTAWWGKKIEWLEKKAHLKGRLIQKYRLLGLALLVAIPLPGTGAWTGALVAALFEIRLRTALPVILGGVLVAGAVVLGASCGVIAMWA
ncbi:MAG: small multi-drug export protein [Oscillospiraceae bacterium]|nr:small multi-drug export protein [Oscillospiraceae bacterium]